MWVSQPSRKSLDFPWLFLEYQFQSPCQHYLPFSLGSFPENFALNMLAMHIMLMPSDGTNGTFVLINGILIYLVFKQMVDTGYVINLLIKNKGGIKGAIVLGIKRTCSTDLGIYIGSFVLSQLSSGRKHLGDWQIKGANSVVVFGS